MDLIGRLWMNAEIKRAMQGINHYGTIEEANTNLNTAYSTITKYLDDISPMQAQELRKQIERAETDLKNKMTLGYIV